MNRCRLESDVSSDRAQAALIGVVLLIGMVATVSIGIFLVAGETISSAESETEAERVEQAFVELSQNMRSVSANSDVSRSMELDAGEFGAVVKENTSTIRIAGGDVDTTIPVGAIEYQGDDGTTIAYQGGAVFRETGEQTQVVSAPPIEYDDDAESLWFPIIKTVGESHLNSGTATISHHSVDPLKQTRVVENDTVTIEVSSEYYRGWENYFERQGGPSAVTDVERHGDDRGTVTAEFGYKEISDAFSNNSIYATDFDPPDGEHYDDEPEQSIYPELDPQIDRLINETEEPNDEYDGEEITHLGAVDERVDATDSVYFADEITEDGHIDFDLSNGNATLVVDGDINATDRTITVSDYEEGNTLSVYVSGDYDAKNGGETCVTMVGCDENEDAKVIQMSMSGESTVDFGPGGQSRFEGVIYAGGTNEDWEERNGCDSQICVISNPDLYGSILASSIDLNSAAFDLEYDESLRDADLDIYPDTDLLPPQLTYLNVAEHKVNVDGT